MEYVLDVLVVAMWEFALVGMMVALKAVESAGLRDLSGVALMVAQMVLKVVVQSVCYLVV